MRRRRKKNPLLARIIIVSVAAHAIALPIAAHFGAFSKVRHQFGSANLVVINTPPLEEKKAPEKSKKRAKPERTEAKKSAATTRRSGPSKPNPNAPKVITNTGPGGDSGGASADPNGTGKLGVVPTGPVTAPPSGPGKSDQATTPPPSHPLPPPPPPPSPLPPNHPSPQPVNEKKFVQVETTYAPEPTIPDDLRTDSFEKTAIVEADVNPEGLPENVKIAESSGNKELDEVGLDTAKKYKFKPATLDDLPVEGHVRFRIIFKVE